MARRRITALVVSAAMTLLISGCGFNTATGRDYTPAHGANEKDGMVDVLGAVVVSAEPGSGTFIASLANNNDTGSVSLTSIGGFVPTEFVGNTFAPIPVPATQLVDLSDDPTISVSGDFAAGDFIHLQLVFSDGSTTAIDVPVVRNEGIWADLDVAPRPSPEATS